MRDDLTLALENALTALMDAEADSPAEAVLLPDAIEKIEALLAAVRETDGAPA